MSTIKRSNKKVKKNKKSFKSILTIVIPIIIILAATIAVICVINNSSDKKNKKNASGEEKNIIYLKKELFADEVINYTKAAETAYVDKTLKDIVKKIFTVKELTDEYIKGDYDFKGCITLDFDKNGYVGDKTVYITDGTYMIIGKTAKEISKDISSVVKEYDSSLWKKDYESCKNLK